MYPFVPAYFIQNMVTPISQGIPTEVRVCCK